MDSPDINHPLLKGSTALATLGLMELDFLTNVGRLCAALTAIVIFGEVLWKKVIVPLRELVRERK